MIAHGTATKYSNHKCRCNECKAAWAAYVLQRRRQRARYVVTEGLPSSVAHGAAAYVNWGCRCDICLAAELDRQVRRRREKKAAR